MRFPYKKELSRAYGITIQNPWLWVFGLFIGGISGNFFNRAAFDNRSQTDIAQDAEMAVAETVSWILSHPIEFIALILLALSILIIVILLQGLSRGAVIWAAVELSKKEEKKRDPAPIGFSRALRASLKYLNKIVGLQLLLILFAVAFLAIVTFPILFLFSVGAGAKAAILLLLALSLFLPALAVIFFSFIFGPIFIVMYRAGIAKALALSFKLIKKRFWQCLGVLFVLSVAAVGVGVVAEALFALISASGAGLSLLVAHDMSNIPGMILFFGSILIASICVIVLGSAYASFAQVFWTIAVKKMMAELELDEKEEALAIEPAHTIN